jgi:hypothetical protein
MKKEKSVDGGTLVALGAEGANLYHFPYIPIGSLKYSDILLGLMSQSASFQLLESAGDLKSLF